MNDVYILNATNKSVHTKAFGNYFDIAAGHVKRFSKNMGEFIAETKGYLGLVAVPEEMGDHNKVEFEGKVMLYRETPAGQDEFQRLKRSGVDKRVDHLTAIVHNLRHSVAQDLAGAEMKIDPLALASKGEEDAMDELLTYQKSADDENKARIERLRKATRSIDANSTAQANRK